MITLALLAGIWTTTCIQTQISNDNQGYVKERYTIELNGEFVFEREWYSDPQCEYNMSTDSEFGTITLGKKINSLFFPGETNEADFNTQNGIDLGAVSLKENKSLKIARGVRNSSMRNTMLSLFEYRKQ